MGSIPFRSAITVLLFALATGCSAVTSTFVLEGYSPTAPAALKHLDVVAAVPMEDGAVGADLARVAADRIALRKNYLVHDAAGAGQDWCSHCKDRDAILLIRFNRVVLTADGADVAAEASLVRCSDSVVVWRAAGELEASPNTDDLAKLHESYEAEFGKRAATIAIPAFILFQDLFESLPNPQLNDEELMLKIELEA